MQHKQLISRDIERFYNKASEETRLNKGLGVFEFERVKSLIEKHLNNSPCKILDVGGGTGKYAEWLTKKGHEVHLIEPVDKHLLTAQSRSNSLKNKFSVHKGESRSLDFSSNYADVIILHGPLYHLQKQEDRALTIQEAKRVLKKDGILLAFAINNTASTIAGLLSGLIHKKSFLEMCKLELSSGIHNPPEDFPWLLAEAFYHKPEKLREELIREGLVPSDAYAVEGAIWLDKDFFSNMQNTKRRCNLMELLEATENDKSLLPFSPHYMISAKKQSNYGS